MKWLYYMGILKGFSAYSSPVMLISRKLTKDKRVVTDFRHLNVRIAKSNLAYPLVRDTFSVLRNSKDCQKTQRSIVTYSHISVAHLIYIRECPWD